MQKYYDRLAELLKSNSEFVIDEKLNKNMLAELARKYDAGLFSLLSVSYTHLDVYKRQVPD